MRIQKRQTKATPGDYSLTILPLATAKLNMYLGSDTTYDAIITQYIKAGVQHFESGLDYYIDTSGLIYQYYDGFGSEGYLPIWHRYIKTADLVVEYYNGTTFVAVDAANYRIDIANTPPRVLLKESGEWPTPSETLNNVRVGFKMDTSHSFLEEIRAGVMAYVAARYENREAIMNPNVQAVIDRHKLHG